MDDKWKRPPLTFTIDEGTRYHIAGVRFVGSRKFTDEQLREGLALKVGEYYDRRNLQQDLKRLNEMYRAYLSATIRSELETDDESGAVTVIFSIMEADYFSRFAR